MNLRTITVAIALFWATVHGTEYKPWYPPVCIPVGELNVATQIFSNVDTKYGRRHYHSTDLFVDVGALFSYSETTCLELECDTAQTRQRTYGLDQLKFTGRYLWFDDVIGDPISLSTGASIAKVFKPSRHDLAVFHHGGIEGEIHASIGRENVCEEFWTSRWWCVGAVGWGDLGSAWLRGDLHYSWNWWDDRRIDVYAHSLWGLGNRDLKRIHHFHGYGPINHQNIDIGISYTRIFPYEIEVKLDYSYRVYAKNCPIGTNLILLRILYPFGL